MPHSLSSLPLEIIQNLTFFTNQADLLSLSRTCHALHTQCVKKLYQKIYIRSDPRLSGDSSFIDSTGTELAGRQSVLKRNDQNDYLIYLKLLQLSESLSTYGELVKEVTIFDNVFSTDDDQSHQYLNDFIDALQVKCSNLERFVSYDDKVKQLESKTGVLKNFITSDLKELDNVDHQVDSITVNLHRYTEDLQLPELSKLHGIKELVLQDEESASLRLLKLLSEGGLSNLKLERLVFNHVHGLHDYNTVLRQLTVEFIDSCVDLSSLKELEIGIGCQERGCDCLGVFLDELAPKLTSLQKISLHEQTYHRDHYLTEEWDVSIGRFLINVPSKLKFVALHHNPPLDGKLENGLEGNYLRRRRLFETVAPQLKHLETFISPTFIQSCACYEVLPSDLLWNGCECDFCNQFLPFYDKYLMDHAYYDAEETDFKDMISPRLFGMFGYELTKRLTNRFDLDTLKFPPSSSSWDFHGYKTITCFNDVDKCVFDKKLFEPLVVCASHFMIDSAVKFLVKACPNLKNVVLTGVFFTVDENREIHCVYDTPDKVLS